MESGSCAAALTQVMYVRSLRDQCGARLRQVRSGDGGIPTVALQTSNVWANVVTAVVLFLSSDSALRRDDHGIDPLSEDAEWYGDLGGVYCALYERCKHGEALAVFRLVNSTGRRHNTDSDPPRQIENNNCYYNYN